MVAKSLVLMFVENVVRVTCKEPKIYVCLLFCLLGRKLLLSVCLVISFYTTNNFIC